MEEFLVVDLNSSSSTVSFSPEICKIPEGPEDEDGDGFCGDQLINDPEKPRCSDLSEESFRDLTGIHAAETPCLCDQCDERSKRADCLKNHQLSHTGEKPYYCDLCKKHFRCSSHVKSHQDKRITSVRFWRTENRMIS